MFIKRSNVRNIINRIAAEKGIEVMLNTEIVSVNMNDEGVGNDNTTFLVAADGRQFAFTEAIWCTEVVN